jgi:hypothetical protein
MEAFLLRQRELLMLEHDAEKAENEILRRGSTLKELETKGLCIRSLRTGKVKSGLSGRLLVSLCKENGDLPHTKLSSGDIVGIFTKDVANPECSGVVYGVHRAKIVVACDEFTLEEAVCNVVMLTNEVTHKRQMQALDQLERLNTENPAYHLAMVLMKEAEPRFGPCEEVIPVNPRLNEKQIQAVSFAASSCKDIGISPGPPGTGKTTTIVEVIQQLVARGQRVLATAPSNIAVDNMLEQLGDKVPVVRLGHPARILPHLERFSLDNKVKRSDQNGLLISVNKDIARVNELIKTTRGGERIEHRQQLRELRKEVKERSAKAVLEVLSHARVVLGTNIAAGGKLMGNAMKAYGPFDTVVIDEAAQALEISCWIPLLKGRRLILSGDHKQLPPTIKSQEAQTDLSVTLMARACEAYPQTVLMLEEQYRMHEAIMAWPSSQFYAGRLLANESVRTWTLPNTEGPLMFIDTAGCEMRDSGDAGDSKYNLGEASLVDVFVQELRTQGVRDIGVITPYSAQVEVLLGLSLSCEVSTVDGFQGREKDAIVISLVRSNAEREVGFLSDERRLNVAITRARKLLCVIGDSDTLASNRSTNSLRSFVSHLHEHAIVRGVQAYYQHDQRIVLNQGALFAPAKPKTVQTKTTKTAKNPAIALIKPGPAPDPYPGAEERIREFAEDEEAQELRLDPMPGNVREQVHRLCEELGLEHVSRGTGASRYVIVSKAIPAEEEDDEPIQPIDSPPPQQLQPSNPVQHKPKPAPKPLEKLTEDEELKFLDDIVEAGKYCVFPSCKEALNLISSACKFCNRTFCLHHSHAELHGCGTEVRAAARASLTSVHSHQLKGTERKVLLDRLHKKQAEQRTASKPKKKK